jgi:hypothetical protein
MFAVTILCLFQVCFVILLLHNGSFSGAEDLQKQGYTGGPSVLYMKPPEEAAQANWAW